MKIGPRGKKKVVAWRGGGWRAGITYLSLGLRETFLAEEVSRVGITVCVCSSWASLVAQMVKNPPAMQETQVPSLGWEYPLEKDWQPTPVFLPGKFHRWRRLAGYSPWDCKESEMTTEQQVSNTK